MVSYPYDINILTLDIHMPPHGYVRSWFDGRSEPVRLGVRFFSEDRRRRDYFEEDEYSSLEDGYDPRVPLERSSRRRHHSPHHSGYIHHSRRSRGFFDVEDGYLDDGEYGTGYEPGYLEQETPRQSYPWERMRGPWYDPDDEFEYAEGRPAGNPRHDHSHGFESGRSFSGSEHRPGGRRRHYYDNFDGYTGSSDYLYGGNDANDHGFDHYTSEDDWIPEYPTHGRGRGRHNGHPEHDRPRGSRRREYFPPEYEIHDDGKSVPPRPRFGGRYGGRRRRRSRRATAGQPTGYDNSSITLENGMTVPSNCYELIGGKPSMDHKELNRAIKLARARVHPDKLKKLGMSAEEEREIDDASTAVAQAAEILKDPMVRALYDEQNGR